MAHLNIQDEESWDDFSSTQLERIDYYTATVNKNNVRDRQEKKKKKVALFIIMVYHSSNLG